VNEARDTVLARIRTALSDRAAVPDVPRDYAERGAGAHDDVVARFVAQVEELGGEVVSAADARSAIASTLAAHGASRVVVAPDLPPALRPDGIELVEDGGLTPWELDALDGALTTCAAACADTGTVALDGGPGQGRRAITLVPDLHVCVVTRDQVVETVPELFARLAPSAREARPIVLVSGPSATSDLGFERVEGVHGPRRFVVVLAP
jgi:L-lactate dehydrogenase complex protein LldG